MRTSVLLLTVLLAAGCKAEKEPEVRLVDALPNLPLPPNAQVLAREFGPDAAKFKFYSPNAADMVVDYYRNVLSTAPFTLVSDSKTGSTYTLYAEQPGRPSMWVTVTPDSLRGGSFVDLAGAKNRK